MGRRAKTQIICLQTLHQLCGVNLLLVATIQPRLPLARHSSMSSSPRHSCTTVPIEDFTKREKRGRTTFPPAIIATTTMALQVKTVTGRRKKTGKRWPRSPAWRYFTQLWTLMQVSTRTKVIGGGPQGSDGWWGGIAGTQAVGERASVPPHKNTSEEGSILQKKNLLYNNEKRDHKGLYLRDGSSFSAETAHR